MSATIGALNYTLLYFGLKPRQVPVAFGLPSDAELQNLFAQSGFELVQRRIQQLSFDECRQQCRLIEMPVQAR
jgi:hypothetical protein